jgi:ABC-type Fe3+ transport system substrate-binding protein
LSATTSIVLAKQKGAPVEAHFYEVGNVIATEKWMLAADAPSPAAGKLFLSYLHTVEAQQAVLAAGNFPINQDPSLTSPHGWPSLADVDFVPLPEQAVVRQKSEEFGPIFKRLTAG